MSTFVGRYVRGVRWKATKVYPVPVSVTLAVGIIFILPLLTKVPHTLEDVPFAYL